MEEFLKKFGWPLLGVSLVIAGCLLMWSETGKEHVPSLTFLVLVLIGLGMISMERVRPIIDMVRDLIPGEAGRRDGVAREDENNVDEDSKIQEKVAQNQDILGVDKAPPAPNEWYEVLRPVLHQASYYTVPTYYLSVNLHFIDWNIAFDMMFGDILAKVRNRHVNYFIATLENVDEVFGHAHDFTDRVARGHLPLVDTETLVYRSPKYGRISFMKVATQLHDANGELHGWAVALIIREMEWGTFEGDLRERLRQDKLWSLYASSYDKILLEFPDYEKLILDVIDVLPTGGRSVVDLGAGTGNVTTALLNAGHRVTAVENNIAMLDRLRAKRPDSTRVSVVKASVEDLGCLKENSFDGAIMVNVLYAVGDPLACLRGIARVLRPGGVLGLSTTHSNTRLDPLLNAIRNHLQKIGRFPALAEDYERLRECNKDIEESIACRHSIEQYCEWVRSVGFEITRVVPSTYQEAVMLLHARKIDKADRPQASPSVETLRSNVPELTS